MINKCDMNNIIRQTLLKVYPKLVAIYHFGSSATGTTTSESDIDLAILPWEKPLDAQLLWQTGQKLASLLSADVDLIDLLRASTVMRMQIVSTGKLIYQNNEIVRERFEDYIFSAYSRLNESRKEIIQSIQNRGNIYG